jgi:transposase
VIAAQFVKPYVKSNKNDRVDAEAICEAVSRPNMRYVAPKTVAQQGIQAAHLREELVGQRTAKANQIRGLVGEYGIVAPVGIQQFRRALPAWLLRWRLIKTCSASSKGLSPIFSSTMAANPREDFRKSTGARYR